jgi:tetratricopeptide (TPR) repeat protein
MVALAIACAVTTILVQQLLGAIRNDPWSARLANATVSCGRYLWMTIVPKGLAIFYPMHTRLLNGHIPAWQIILSGATLATLTLIVALLYKRVPALLVGWMWYVVALVPVIGLMQSGDQSHADRFTYIPLIGIFAAVAWAIEALTRGRAALRNIAAMIAVATLVGALIVSSRQIGYWRDTTTVMTRAIDVVPNNYVAHRNIGEWYDGHGETARAEAEYHETLRIKPDDVSALQHLAAHAMKAGDDAEAIRLFREALFADPGNGDIYNDYANLLAKQGKTADAIAVYRAGIKRAPSVKELYHNLALLLGEQGAMNDAIPLWQQAIQLDPNYVDAHASLGTAQVMTGQTRRGLAELQTALKLQPDRIDALKSRAWILATHPSALYQNGAEAQVLASRAVELTHRDDPIALDILAASQARNGKFEDAIKSAEDAAELARMQDQRSLLAQIQRRIEIYRSRKAFTSG